MLLPAKMFEKMSLRCSLNALLRCGAKEISLLCSLDVLLRYCAKETPLLFSLLWLAAPDC